MRGFKSQMTSGDLSDYSATVIEEASGNLH